MITIENENFRASINPLGAELTQLSDKKTSRQLIWNDEKGKYWGRHAPVLFPAIGKSNDDQYTLDDDVYRMPQHGFARDFQFDEIHLAGSSEASFTLHANDETRALYPFDFALTIDYQLTEKGLRIIYTVANQTEKPKRPMPFALGVHPGFALSQPLEKYSVTLLDAKTPLTKFGIGPVPFRDGELETFTEAEGNVIPLSHALLDDGLIIVDAPEATAAVLASSDGSEKLTLSLADFPYLTLWSPEGKNAPFVCVEPFNGLPDVAGKPSNWFKKTGNTVVESGESRHFTLDLTIG